MAELPIADRQRIWRGLMRYWSREKVPIAISKTELQAAVNALDTWVNDNAAAVNNALPAGAKANLTTEQKAFLLAVVVLARYDLAILRQMVGELD